jgi:hypothetical protein
LLPAFRLIRTLEGLRLECKLRVGPSTLDCPGVLSGFKVSVVPSALAVRIVIRENHCESVGFERIDYPPRTP